MSGRAWRQVAALLACLGLPPSLVADEGTVIPPQGLVYCTVCHGVQLGGNRVLQAPRISGLPGWYLRRQLDAFRNDWRGVHEQDDAGHEMRPMAASLSVDEMERAIAYVEAVDSAPPRVTLDGDAGRGESLYSSCAACHGQDAGGNEALMGPPLTSLDDWYLLAQLVKFQSGVRGSDPDDNYGRQMQAAAAMLPDEQAMKDVIRYISTLRDQ